MIFEPLPDQGTEANADDFASGQPLDMMQLIQIAALSAVTIFLGLFVVRPILMSTGTPAAALPAPNEEGFDGLGAADGSDDIPPMMSGFPDMMAIGDGGMGGMGDMDFGGGGGVAAGGGEDPVGRLRQMITDHETESLQILEDWMDEPQPQERA